MSSAARPLPSTSFGGNLEESWMKKDSEGSVIETRLLELEMHEVEKG